MGVNLRWAAPAAIVCVFYLWTAWTSGNGPDHYPLLAEGFLRGQLHLSLDPSPDLLALANPRDPQQNEPFRLHDVSLYGSRYYLYFGPAPVVSLYIPWRLASGEHVPVWLASALFACAGYLFSVAALRRAGTRITPEIAALALGLCQFVPYMLRRPALYEVAIAAGYCFFMGAVWLWLRGSYAASSIFFVLAVASRPHYALAAAVFMVVLLLRRPRELRPLLAFGVPLAAGAAALAWYNYARFGDPFELGIRYMLGGASWLQELRLSPTYVPAGLFYFLFCPPQLIPEFPFFRLAPIAVPHPNPYFLEPVAGALIVTPAICWAAAAVRRYPMLLASSVAMLVFVSMTGWTTQRYSVDFTPSLLLAALAVARPWKHLTAAALVWGMLVNVGISFVGYEDALREKHPSIWRSLGGQPDPAFRIEAEIVPPERPARHVEPLLTAGQPYAGHVVAIRYENEGTVRIFSNKWGAGGPTSAALEMPPGQPERLTFDYRDRTLRVVLQGKVVVEHRMAMYPTRDSELLVGENRIAPGVFGPRFSGQLKVRSRELR